MSNLSKTIQDVINDQIHHEIASAYLYLSMSAQAEAMAFPGAAKWLKIQWKEELGHAMRFFEYVYARGGRVLLKGIEAPPVDFASLTDIFQHVLTHEQKVTSLIHRICDMASKDNDYATQAELQWFVKEQVEEEKSAADILRQLKVIGESGPSLLMLDHQLGARGN